MIHNSTFFTIVIFCAVAVAAFAWRFSAIVAHEADALSVTNFDQCVAFGGDVADEQPRTCTISSYRTFTEDTL